jgi:hypothetical protein
MNIFADVPCVTALGERLAIILAYKHGLTAIF